MLRTAIYDESTKLYVDVLVSYSSSGAIVPLLIGLGSRKYPIDRILSVERSASRKSGGRGLCYLCYISGKVIKLYWDKQKWFLARELRLND
ncbi:MAG: hypothetical protein Q4P72_03810 [Eubacteriales bacterium]|nr:hypothetical protein [Eubacteriales bacterium]